MSITTVLSLAAIHELWGGNAQAELGPSMNGTI